METQKLPLCVRESSLYTGDQNPSAADLATHFSVLWAVLTMVLESVIGTHSYYNEAGGL